MRIFISNDLLPKIKPELDNNNSLKLWVCGKEYKNPVGIGAGFDTYGKSVDGILRLGFGHCEIGSCAKDGKRMKNEIEYNLAEKSIKWSGITNFHSLGIVKSMLNSFTTKPYGGRLGVNIGISEETNETVPYLAEHDFCAGIEEFTELEIADYLVLNLVGPKPLIGINQYKNLETLENLLAKIQKKREFEIGLLAAYEQEKIDSLENPLPNKTDIRGIRQYYRKPDIISHIPQQLFLKVSVDLSDEQIMNIAKLSIKYDIDGLIVSAINMSEKEASEKSIRVLQKFYIATEGKIALISSGGIRNGKEAYERIKNGASLIQICSGVLLEGPYIGIKILEELQNELKNDGLLNIQEAIGKNCVLVMKKEQENQNIKQNLSK